MEENEIVVRIDPASEPIAGTVGRAAGELTAFVGYGHLVAAIEHHREAGADAGSGQGDGIEGSV